MADVSPLHDVSGSATANDRQESADGCDLFTAIVITVSASPPIHIGIMIDWNKKGVDNVAETA